MDTREIHIFDDPDATPREWRVEEIDSDDDGGCDVAIFSGPHAEERAKRYAEQLADMMPISRHSQAEEGEAKEP